MFPPSRCTCQVTSSTFPPARPPYHKPTNDKYPPPSPSPFRTSPSQVNERQVTYHPLPGTRTRQRQKSYPNTNQVKHKPSSAKYERPPTPHTLPTPPVPNQMTANNNTRLVVTPSQLETRFWGHIIWNLCREGFGGSEGVENLGSM